MVKETRAARRFSSRATKNKTPARHKQGADVARVGNKQGAGAKTRKGGAAAAGTTTALSAALLAPSELAAVATVPAAAPAAPALGAPRCDSARRGGGRQSLEEAEARMIAPPSEDELKEKSERRKASKKASKLRKHVQAVQLSESDEASFPMPLTIAEAKVLVIFPGHQAK